MTHAANVAGGHKAAIANPHIPEETKEHSMQVLEEMEGRGEVVGGDNGDKHEANVARGHKAALKNPNVSEEAKQRSEQVLEEMGA